jgi:protein-disulfide isomerase
MSVFAPTATPRRARGWATLVLGAGLTLLGVAIFLTATRPAGSRTVQVSGIENMQSIFGGVPQEADRLGSSDAPVSVQLFADLQCSSCREDFLAIVPGLVEDFARPGDAQLLLRHYSVAENPVEIGFFGAEAAAQQGYGWQYTYLFFRNQEEAGRFGIDDEFLETLAGSIAELDVGEWREYLEAESGPGGAITRKLEGYEQLGTDLGIRTRPAVVVSGPAGTRTLQDGPALNQVERAIEAVG